MLEVPDARKGLFDGTKLHQMFILFLAKMIMFTTLNTIFKIIFQNSTKQLQKYLPKPNGKNYGVALALTGSNTLLS
jgi:hypothetical protein